MRLWSANEVEVAGEVEGGEVKTGREVGSGRERGRKLEGQNDYDVSGRMK